MIYFLTNAVAYAAPQSSAVWFKRIMCSALCSYKNSQQEFCCPPATMHAFHWGITPVNCVQAIPPVTSKMCALMLFKCFSCFRIDSGHGREEKKVCMNERVGE